MFDNKLDKTYSREIPIESCQQISFVFDRGLISESDRFIYYLRDENGKKPTSVTLDIKKGKISIF